MKNIYFGMRMDPKMKVDLQRFAEKADRNISDYVSLVLKKHIKEKKLLDNK